ELTSLLQAWCPPDVEASDPLLVENGQHLGGALRVSAALLQGVDELDAGRPAAALAHLQVAATGLCSRQALARIFALMGCCSWKAVRAQRRWVRSGPRAASGACVSEGKEWKWWRSVRGGQRAGLWDSGARCQGEAALACPCSPPRSAPESHTLRARGPRGAPWLPLTCPFLCRAAEAVEHYLDLLALLQDGPPSALPRVPEVFLEAASGLQELARHRDAIAVCEEVVARASELVPERLQVELGCSARAMAGSLRAQAAGVPARQTRESLCCVLWRAAAYLAQGWAWAGLGDPKEAVGLLSR
uniref:FANCG protein n=1 Tax=Varanus komodoensis TaxID=61221 RepID=A0A8D2LMV4_VARKO